MLDVIDKKIGSVDKRNTGVQTELNFSTIAFTQPADELWTQLQAKRSKPLSKVMRKIELGLSKLTFMPREEVLQMISICYNKLAQELESGISDQNFQQFVHTIFVSRYGPKTKIRKVEEFLNGIHEF